MPNWVTNELTSTAKGLDAIAKLMGANGIDAMSEDDGIMFDFNKIIPMPESLNIEEGSVSSAAVSYAKGEVPSGFKDMEDLESRFENWDKTKEEMIALGEQILENERLYGCRSWYSWSNMNWGTKWNASETRAFNEFIGFETAWSSPYPVIQKLSELIPDEEITVEYADEDTSHNCGRYTFLNGEEIDSYQPESGSKEAYELAFKISGGDDYYEFSEETGTYEYIED